MKGFLSTFAYVFLIGGVIFVFVDTLILTDMGTKAILRALTSLMVAMLFIVYYLDKHWDK